MKENIIKKLTNLPFILNNKYLKQYIELVSIKNTQTGYQELHHIILRRLPQDTPIYCPELDRTFSLIKDASITLNISDGNICAVVNGKIEKTNGLHFYKINKEQYYEERKNKN